MNRSIKIFLLVLILTVTFVCPVTAYQTDQRNLSLVINEFMASNSSTTRNPQGQYEDWIEIYNYGSGVVDISGMYLTDNLSDPTMWQIPSRTSIASGGYLLIWADEDSTASGLHADFKLDAAGEEIGLFDADGLTLVDSVSYGTQTTDISYGRYPDADDNWSFLTVPSPGTRNEDAYLGQVKTPKFSRDHGFFNEPIFVTIATETDDTDIYYTLDGSQPGQIGARGMITGTLYTGPIYISRTTCMQAVAIKAGWLTSKLKTQTYIFINDVIRQSPSGQAPGAGWPTGNVNGQVIDYGMDPDVVNNSRYSDRIEDSLLAVPTISLVTDLTNLFSSTYGIYVNASQDGRDWERPVSVELINPDGSEGFQIDAGLRIRGGYSRRSSNPKHAFRLLFRPEYG